MNKISHIDLSVNDWDRVSEFYDKLLASPSW